jgi:hypothetical protein
VAWDCLSEILDVEGSLQSRCKETTEWSNQTGKGSHEDDVELNWADLNRCAKDWLQPEWDIEDLVVEDWVGCALQAGQNIGSEVLNGTDEVAELHQDVGQNQSDDNGAKPGSNKSFDGLLGRYLDKLGATESDAADVGEDVVGNDKRDGKEEPDHAFENVVDDELRLDNDKVQGQMSPCELGELELVVALFERCDEQDKA